MLERTTSAEEEARALMQTFARRTGLLGGQESRYLWTDAYAVCTYLTLHLRARDPRALALAVRLVGRVHHVLGRFRPDDRRSGWISGLSEAEGERHPTAGGLRVGKPLPERAPDEPFDERLEWERDGQHAAWLVRRALEQRPLADAMLSLWRTPNARASGTWAAHQDINDVMLAAALAPDECLSV